MESLKKKIHEEGIVIGDDILKVDGFLNYQMDVRFFEEMGEEIKRRYEGEKIDKILTVEASGIGVACIAARHLGYVPVVFAKKTSPSTLVGDFYSEEARSFTKGTISNLRVAKPFIKEGERILILDDFLAHGEAAAALVKIVRTAGAEVVGVTAVIEKGFQPGAERLRGMGCRVESLAVIKGFENGKVMF